MDVLALLLWSLQIALGAVGLTIILRNAPVIRGWVLEAKKPWACNVCMPLWTALALDASYAVVAGGWLKAAFVFLPAYTLAFVLLKKVSEPPEEPFEIPEDSEV